MRTREEVVALIGEHDLDEHRDAILAAVRPGYRLQAHPDGSHRIGDRLTSRRESSGRSM